MSKGQKYDHICIIGNGILAKDCCKYLAKERGDIHIYDSNEEPSWYLKRLTESLEGVDYFFGGKREIFDSIRSIEGSILIISAVNPYLIPKDIVNEERIFSVNLHHALLPRHPGRNAECWAIYEMDEYAGITWHVVSEKVDAGNIIARAQVELTPDMTAWKLLKIQNKLAYSEFEGFAEGLLRGELSHEKQEERPGEKLHYSYEKPNDGFFDMEWSAEKMSAFLRSMDYGPVKVMGNPRIIIDSREREIIGYNISGAPFLEEKKTGTEGEIFFINKDGMGISLTLAPLE